MNVTLLAHTPEPEKTVAAAAKLCYSSSSADKLFCDLTDEKAADFVDMLSSIGHASPIEHVSFTFGIDGISRACSHQLVRHRIASYSQQSQRYVKSDMFEYVTPPEIAANPEAKAEFDKAMQECQAHYDKIAEILTASHLEQMNETDEKAATKKAIEDARFVLPNAATTKIVVTMNVRSLQNFFNHRCCNRAQWEIREMADKMLTICKQVAPNLFKLSGPPCVRGACPEGKMSCKKAQEMRAKYNG